MALFYDRCQEHRRRHGNDATVASARAIHEDFFSSNALYPITIPAPFRDRMNLQLAFADAGFFDVVQQYIHYKLSSKSLSRAGRGTSKLGHAGDQAAGDAANPTLRRSWSKRILSKKWSFGSRRRKRQGIAAGPTPVSAPNVTAPTLPIQCQGWDTAPTDEAFIRDMAVHTFHVKDAEPPATLDDACILAARRDWGLGRSIVWHLSNR